MKTIKSNWLKIYGYLPTDNEILNHYQSGALIITDQQENEIIKYFNL